MENIKYTFVTLPGGVTVLRGGGYEYRINKRKDEKTYWKCKHENCSARASTVNDDINTAKRGRVDHNHRPDEKVQKKMTDNYPMMDSSDGGAKVTDTDQSTEGNLKNPRGMTDRHSSPITISDSDESQIEESGDKNSI